jgi:hypothetical protein
MTEKLLQLSKGAAFVGSSDVLTWAQSNADGKWPGWHQQLCVAAAAGNQLATLQDLRSSSPEQQWEVVKVAAKAAECADLSMLQWVVEQHSDWTVDSIQTVIESAAGAADAIDKMSWLRQRFAAYDRLVHHFIRASITCGAVPTLKWCASRGYRFLQQAATAASAAGQLAVLCYLVEEAGCPWNPAAVRTAAARAGSIEILQWARSADPAVWSTEVLSALLAVAGQNTYIAGFEARTDCAISAALCLAAAAAAAVSADAAVSTLARCFHALNLCMRESLSCLRVHEVSIVSALIEGACG